jgi:type IV pilus assembly protein PilB
MRIEGINQVEVAPEKGLTMSSILRSLLVQDPNVICLSEINNEEIARLALRASTTGRIVISTVHSKNASTTVDMLSNMNIETYLLASTLSGIISQRLVKKLCPKCRRQKEANTFEKTIFRRALNKNINILYEPVGCNECIDGYQGRLPIAEVVEINNEMRTAIANHKDSDTLYNILYKDTNTILQDGLIMAMNGDTSFEEIMRVVDYESDFNKDNEAIKKTILGAASETMKESQKEVEQIGEFTYFEYNIQVYKSCVSLDHLLFSTIFLHKTQTFTSKQKKRSKTFKSKI